MWGGVRCMCVVWLACMCCVCCVYSVCGVWCAWLHDSLVPALRMGTIGPLNRWVGSSAVVLTNQAAITNNRPIIVLKHATLGAVLGNSCLIGKYYSTRAYPSVEWTCCTHSKSPN